MKRKTIDKFIEHLSKAVSEGLTKGAYSSKYSLSSGYFNNTKLLIAEAYNSKQISEEEYKHISSLYNEVCGNIVKKSKVVETTDEDIENQRATTELERNEEGSITGYSFSILIKNKAPLKGMLTREEMNEIYRLYSAYGSNISQREVSRFFPEFSLVDFKRILRAFNITKASAQFAPHLIEELPESELKLMALREKENNLLRSIEAEQVKNNERLVKELTKKNYYLESQLGSLDKTITEYFGKELVGKVPIVSNKSTQFMASRDTLIIHLADIHFGAKTSSNSLYPNDYNKKEVERRLDALVDLIPVKDYSMVVINFLGDMLDGMDRKTTRRDHDLPQNMDNYEQVNNYLEVMENFIKSLQNKLTPRVALHLYSVKSGNHDGITGYTATKALFAKLQYAFDNITCQIFDDFFGTYSVKGHKFVITHGKDDEFMKRGLPVNLNDATLVKLYEWLDSVGIEGKNIHFIKGDLHQESINSNYKLDYRNVLSLYGASDYGQLNFGKQPHGVSYELIDQEGNLLRGTFTNL